MRKTTIMLIVLMMISIVFLNGCLGVQKTDEEKYLEDWWICDENSELSNYVQVMEIDIEEHYGEKGGSFFEPNASTTSEFFGWDYDKSNSILTMTNAFWGWNLTLRVIFDINEKPKHMTTHYISSSGKSPFNLELFDNVQWGPYFGVRKTN